MRTLTLALLTGAYICLSTILAVLLWRNGGGWAAGLSAWIGTMGLLFAFHGLISRALETARSYSFTPDGALVIATAQGPLKFRKD